MKNSKIRIKELLGFNLDLTGQSYEEIICNLVNWSGINNCPVESLKIDTTQDRFPVVWVSKVGNVFIKVMTQRGIRGFDLVIMIHGKREGEGYAAIYSKDNKVSVDDLKFFKKTYYNVIKRMAAC